MLESLAHGRERQALGAACEQADVQELLELAQGLGHRRLRHRELVGGAADMTETGYLHEALEMANFHARIDHGRLPSQRIGVITAWLSSDAKFSFPRAAPIGHYAPVR